MAHSPFDGLDVPTCEYDHLTLIFPVSAVILSLADSYHVKEKYTTCTVCL